MSTLLFCKDWAQTKTKTKTKMTRKRKTNNKCNLSKAISIQLIICSTELNDKRNQVPHQCSKAIRAFIFYFILI